MNRRPEKECSRVRTLCIGHHSHAYSSNLPRRDDHDRPGTKTCGTCNLKQSRTLFASSLLETAKPCRTRRVRISARPVPGSSLLFVDPLSISVSPQSLKSGSSKTMSESSELQSIVAALQFNNYLSRKAAQTVDLTLLTFHGQS